MKLKTLSVGHADLHQFLSLISTTGWEKTIIILQDAIAAVGDIIVQHGGQIRKYLGDAVLFTVEDPRQAIRAAQAIAAYRSTAEGQAVHFYVGVATGEVWVADFGHASYPIEDIFGDPVIRAIELIQTAKTSPDGVALCEVTKTYA